jgi:hypothetical protein
MSNDSETPPRSASLPGSSANAGSDDSVPDPADHLDPSTGESWVRPLPEPGADLLPPGVLETSLPPWGGIPAFGEQPKEESGLPAPPPRAARARPIPNLGHTLLLLVLAAVTLFATELLVFSIAMATHMFGQESSEQLLREPRLLIPTMAISYLVIVALAWPFFSNLWQEPFPRGVRWNAAAVRRRGSLFLGVGVALSICVQLLSNFLPIPKTLPIDNFFRTPADLWLVAIFGTLLAPACEELAFRGFLLPSLASAWDWMARSGSRRGNGGLGRDLSQLARAIQPRWTARPAGTALYGESGGHDGLTDARRNPLPDPKWSTNALIFSSILTSIGFALLHADQLGHSMAPLAVLFTVSLVLCAVRLKWHSLAASALVHAAYNGTIFTLIFYATDGFRHLDKLAR